MLHTRRSPSLVCTASMSDFWRDEDACQAKFTIGEGPLDVLRLWRIVKRGCSVATRREPFWYLLRKSASVHHTWEMRTYPIANVRQSDAGASAVTAIWSIVLVEICSDVVGSNRIMLPWVLPEFKVRSDSRELLDTSRFTSLTECNITVTHPGCHCEVFIRRESGNFITRHQIPYNRRLARIVADD